MDTAALLATVVGIGIVVAGVLFFVGKSSEQQRKTPRRIYSTPKDPIDRGLKTTCLLIERFYRDRSLPVRVEAAKINYRTSMISATVPANIITSKVANTVHDLEHYLAANNVRLTPGTLKLRVSGKMFITFIHSAMRPVTLSSLFRKEKPLDDSLIVGLTMDGAIARLPLNKAAYPHCLIAGTTGSGKTWAAMVIVINAIYLGWDVVILNPKLRPENAKPGLWSFDGCEGVTYVDDLDEMVVQVRHYATNMQNLKRQVLFVVDETADIIDTLGNDIAQPLGTIAQKGREYGLHLVSLVPKATKSVLMDDKLHASAATALLGLKMNSRNLSMWGTGIGNLGLDQLAGEGHCKMKLGSEVFEIQIAVPDNIEQVCKRGDARLRVSREIDPLTTAWIESLPVGAPTSINLLRQYFSQRGNGRGYALVRQEFQALIDQGRVSRNGTNRQGVKVR